MYRSIKISDESYKKVKLLKRELEDGGELVGLDSVNMSTTVGYALSKTLEAVRKRRKFMSAAGGWKDMENIDGLFEDVRSSRKNSDRGVEI